MDCSSSFSRYIRRMGIHDRDWYKSAWKARQKGDFTGYHKGGHGPVDGIPSVRKKWSEGVPVDTRTGKPEGWELWTPVLVRWICFALFVFAVLRLIVWLLGKI